MVVSDINMPRMDGLSLLAKLQEAEDKLSTIIVSAYGDMANIRTAMNRGAFDFLTKPIDFADLETTIAKTIRHVEVLREARAGRRRPSAPMRRCRAISRRIWPSALPASGGSIDLGGAAARGRVALHRHRRLHDARRDPRPDVLAELLNEYLAG